jgi:uncharacterized cupredoxin-like copper-binding protein
MAGNRAVPWTGRAALVTAAASFVLTGCTRAPIAAGTTIPVLVRDFHIAPGSVSAPAGTITFRVHDQGPSTHEFVVVRTDLPPGHLPLRPDGLTVDEDSPSLRDVGEINDLDIGDSARLTLRLPPGRYVLFCNLEGHYLGGMHALVVVGSGGDDAPSA